MLFRASHLCVGLGGFEPPQTEPKPVVLPLHHSPITGNKHVVHAKCGAKLVIFYDNRAVYNHEYAIILTIVYYIYTSAHPYPPYERGNFTGNSSPSPDSGRGLGGRGLLHHLLDCLMPTGYPLGNKLLIVLWLLCPLALAKLLDLIEVCPDALVKTCHDDST